MLDNQLHQSLVLSVGLAVRETNGPQDLLLDRDPRDLLGGKGDAHGGEWGSRAALSRGPLANGGRGPFHNRFVSTGLFSLVAMDFGAQSGTVLDGDDFLQSLKCRPPV